MSQLYQLYERSHILINPSLSESFGIALVEAMASQLPVIATRVGGMVEIVENGKTGLLVNAAKPQELAEAIIKLSEQSLRESMGNAGRQRVEKMFTWEKITTSLIEAYQSI